MTEPDRTETMADRLVTYTVEVDGRVIVIEHVPARVCLETGERYFSPQTVERIHAIVHGGAKPSRTLTAPVYDFGA